MHKKMFHDEKNRVRKSLEPMMSLSLHGRKILEPHRRDDGGRVKRVTSLNHERAIVTVGRRVHHAVAHRFIDGCSDDRHVDDEGVQGRLQEEMIS